jgi:hypothetical protein
MGRPSSYTQEIADEICERLSKGDSLVQICRDEAMPGLRTVMRWAVDNADFGTEYARAREAQAEVMDDKILTAAEEAAVDAQAARVRIDAYKWRAAKLAPKRYGDKTILGSDPDNPLPAGFQVQFVKPDVSPES